LIFLVDCDSEIASDKTLPNSHGIPTDGEMFDSSLSLLEIEQGLAQTGSLRRANLEGAVVRVAACVDAFGSMIADRGCAPLAR
jgi:hypothetical protein